MLNSYTLTNLAFFYESTYFHSLKPDVKVLRLNNLKSLRQHGGQDRALLSFDIQAGDILSILDSSTSINHTFLLLFFTSKRPSPSISLEFKAALRIRSSGV